MGHNLQMLFSAVYNTKYIWYISTCLERKCFILVHIKQIQVHIEQAQEQIQILADSNDVS